MRSEHLCALGIWFRLRGIQGREYEVGVESVLKRSYWAVGGAAGLQAAPLGLLACDSYGFSIGADSAASRQAGKVLWLQSKAHDHRRRKDIWINVYVHCNKHIWLGSGLYFNLSVFASKRSHRKKVQASYNSPVIYIATKTKIRKN